MEDKDQNSVLWIQFELFCGYGNAGGSVCIQRMGESSCSQIYLGNAGLRFSNYLHQQTFQSLQYTTVNCEGARGGSRKSHLPLDHRALYVHSISWNQCFVAHVLGNAERDQCLQCMVGETETQRLEGTCRKSLGWISRRGGHFGKKHRASPGHCVGDHSPPRHTGVIWFCLEI